MIGWNLETNEMVGARRYRAAFLAFAIALAHFGGVVVGVSAETSGDTIALRNSLKKIDSLQGQFEQEVHTESGKQISSSSGSFKLLQPGYFFWRITVPDEQILVAAGNTLWHYDVELETATRRDIAAEMSQSPLAVLSASEERLEELYTVEQHAENDFVLVPKFEGAAFTRLQLTLVDGVPSTMAVTDHLQQLTLIRFVGVVLNPQLLADEFIFIPPDGIDVYVNQS